MNRDPVFISALLGVGVFCPPTPCRWVYGGRGEAAGCGGTGGSCGPGVAPSGLELRGCWALAVLGRVGGGWVSLYVLSSSSPPPASFPCNAFLSVICGEGDRGKGGSNGGGGEGTGCQGEGLSSFP